MSCQQCQAKASLSSCGLCQIPLCKQCRETLSPKAFSLLESRPAHLSHRTYCGDCFTHKVQPELQEYEAIEARAQHIYFQSNRYRGNPHILNKQPKSFTISKCDDRRQLILMLAYQAAKLNYNAIVGADIRSKRVHAPGGYGHYEWSGSATPANINGAAFEASRID